PSLVAPGQARTTEGGGKRQQGLSRQPGDAREIGDGVEGAGLQYLGRKVRRQVQGVDQRLLSCRVQVGLLGMLGKRGVALAFRQSRSQRLQVGEWAGTSHAFCFLGAQVQQNRELRRRRQGQV